MEKLFLCKTSEIDINESRTFCLPDGTPVVLFRTKSGFYAIENRCPHAGSRLDDGRIKKDTLMCIWHGWKFNLRTNECLTQPGEALSSFSLEIGSSDIFLVYNPVIERND